MTSRELAYKASCVGDSYRHALPGLISEYAVSNCLHRTKIRVFNSSLGKLVDKYVDCGRCYHCKETKQNEWVTRMYAHSDSFKYCYFVTLTYRSLEDVDEHSLDGCLARYLKDALWHRDSLNSTGHCSYNPCVLVKKHYQDFIKRLRKQTGITDLTYVVSGEYGHDFGRPHFHLILWSNSPITYPDVRRAWSVPMSQFKRQLVQNDLFDPTEDIIFKVTRKNPQFIEQIGRIDFQDLVSMGDFSSKDISVDGSHLDARKTFAYVSKYMMKDDFNCNRVSLAYDSLYFGFNAPKAWYKRTKYLHQSYDLTLRQLLSASGNIDLDSQILRHYKMSSLNSIIHQIKNFHENEIFSSNEFSVTQDGLKFHQSYSPDLFLGDKVLVRFQCGVPQFAYSADKDDFIYDFRPFFEMSRACAIGSVFAKAHLDEFQRGVFTQPNCQTQGFVVPKYFRRLVALSVFPVRQVRFSVHGSTIAKGNLPLLLQDMDSVSQGFAPQFLHFVPKSFEDLASPKSIVTVTRDYLRSHALRVGTDRFLFHYDSTGSPYYSVWRYSRKSRNYVPINCFWFNDFVRDYRSGLVKCINDGLLLYRMELENSSRFRDFLSSLRDYDLDYSDLVRQYTIEFDKHLEHRQFLYHLQHRSCE